MDDHYVIKVDDTFKFKLKSSDVEKLDVLKTSKLNYHIINNKKSFNASVEDSNFNNRKYVININSNKYIVQISSPLDLLIKEMGLSDRSIKKTNDIKAPMPGLVLSVNVNVGQEVKEGETLLILEAMKMENAIGAPKDGIIKSVLVKNSDTVDKGQLMVEMA